MKISELTENDVIHIRNKKEAKGIAELLNMKGVKYWKSKQGLDLDRATKQPIQVYEDEFGTAFNYFEKDTSGRNIIPASKFLKQSISKKDLQEALSIVGEELSSMNERLDKLEAKSESKTANGIEIHFNEVTEGLPEKWAVALTYDNYQILHKGYVSPCGYHHSDMVSTNNWSLQLKDGYTEITFETFKKYVLKEEVKEAIELADEWYWLNDALKRIVMKKYGIITLCVFVVMYAITSFGLWELNPNEWGRLNRNGYTGLSICFSVLMCLLSEIKTKD